MALSHTVGLHGLVPLAQTLSGLLPAFFAGTIFGYNYIMIPPILKHSEERALAKQWLEAYQFGARYVRPLVMTTTIANLSLVYLAGTSPYTTNSKLGLRVLNSLLSRPALFGYAISTLSLPALMFYTLGFMEPGINGALKHKVEMLVGTEAADLKKDNIPVGEERDTVTPDSKNWAETESLRSLIMAWKRCNDIRMALAFFGAAVSVYTSLELIHW